MWHVFGAAMSGLRCKLYFAGIILWNNYSGQQIAKLNGLQRAHHSNFLDGGTQEQGDFLGEF